MAKIVGKQYVDLDYKYTEEYIEKIRRGYGRINERGQFCIRNTPKANYKPVHIYKPTCDPETQYAERTDIIEVDKYVFYMYGIFNYETDETVTE